jgi:hypothetical protein
MNAIAAVRHRQQPPTGPGLVLRLPAQPAGVPGHPARRLPDREARQADRDHLAAASGTGSGAALRPCRPYVDKLSPGASPAALIGAVVFWLIFLFVLSAAVGALQIPAVTSFMNQVLAYLPNVIAAVIIFVIAGALAGGLAALVGRLMGETPTGKLVATVVPVLVMGIAVFMILNQLQIAPAIVTITYAALLGSLGLGMALAFGLGGRETAAQLVSGAYEHGQQRSGQVKRDIDLGADRARQAVHERTPDGSPRRGAVARVAPARALTTPHPAL